MPRITLRKPHIAHHYEATTHGSMQPVRVVLHDTESHDTAGIADLAGIYSFWQRQGLGYGAHFVVDADGNIAQGASTLRECWHVGNFNSGSVGIEQIGYASLTRLIWSKRHRAQLRSVAKLLAWLHVYRGIPLTIPSRVEEGCVGVMTHAMVGASGIDMSGHTDPGSGYPLRYVVWLARRFVKKGGWDR